jgi:hypothetical protein
MKIKKQKQRSRERNQKKKGNEMKCAQKNVLEEKGEGITEPATPLFLVLFVRSFVRWMV